MLNERNAIVFCMDRNHRESLRASVAESNMRAFCFDGIIACLDNFTHIAPQMVLCDRLPFPTLCRFMYHIKELLPLLPVIVIGHTETVLNLVHLNKFRNVSVLKSPADPADIAMRLRRTKEVAPAGDAPIDPPIIVGESPEIHKIKKIVIEAARSQESIMIGGEQGAGKDLVARVIHQRSDCPLGRMVKIDIQELSRNGSALTSALKGRGGPFSGTRRGASPSRSTVYLDGIEHLNPSMQNELADLLDKHNGSPENPGKKNENRWRIISATRTGFETMIRNGNFDRALLHRLSVFQMTIPPLRERPEDIPLLIDVFSDRYSRIFSHSFFTVSSEEKSRLIAYRWPGNLRELEIAIKHMAQKVGRQNRHDAVGVNRRDQPVVSKAASSRKGAEFFEHIDQMLTSVDIQHFALKPFCKTLISEAEKRIIKRALDQANWNRRKASRMLRISYKSLLNKIKEYEIS